MPVKILDWSNFGADGENITSGTTVDTGGVAVTFDFLAEDEGASARNYDAHQYVAPGESFDPCEGLRLFGAGGEGGVDNTSTSTLSFAAAGTEFGDAVSDVSFRINDIDMSGGCQNFQDIVTVRAYDADGNLVPVTLTAGSDIQLAGGTAIGDDSPTYSSQPNDASVSLLVEIAGPITRIEIDYDNGGDDQQAVWLTDLEFSTTDPEISGLDGYVDGSSGDDLIDVAYTGDPDGDRIDQNDQILPGEGEDDDIVRAGGGDDTVLSGSGDDDVFGGEGHDSIDGQDGNDILRGEAGNDTILGGEGADTVFGGDGNDVINTGSTSGAAIDAVTFVGVPVDTDPNNDRDFVDGGAGDDTINTGDDSDTVLGGVGNDVIDTGIDDDVIDGGDGNDSIIGGQGADSIQGGDGDDTIIAGVDLFSDYVGDDPNLPNPLLIDPTTGLPALSDPNTQDNRDTVDGGAGNDIIMTGDDADFITGGSGNDTINAGIDDDLVEGNSGDDSIIGSHGSDTILGGDGDDTIWGGFGTDPIPGTLREEPDATDPVPTNGLDSILGGAGNDLIYGEDDDDTLYGGIGNDTIDGGVDDDSIFGEQGADLLIGGEGDDTISGGDGDDTVSGGAGSDVLQGNADRDVFLNVGAGDTVDGGTSGIDFDTLDLTGLGPFSIVNQTVDADGDSTSGQVNFLDAGGNVTGTLDFSEIEKSDSLFHTGNCHRHPARRAPGRGSENW